MLIIPTIMLALIVEAYRCGSMLQLQAVGSWKKYSTIH